MYLSLVAFAALAAAIPYPFSNHTQSASTGAKSSCKKPGALLCNGQTKFGLCNINHSVVWGDVAAGTICTCESGVCAIVASSIGPSGALSKPQPSNTAPTKHKPMVHRPPKYTSHPSPPSSTPHLPAPSSPLPSNTVPPHATPSAPTPSSSPSSGSYKMYSGNGSPEQGWPTMSQWMSFDDLWNGYKTLLGQNCETAFNVPNNTPEETEDIRNALLSESKTANISAAFALAIMMQESLGCAHVDTTNGGVVNPGLFQSHDGTGTCFNTPQCPASEIQQMVHDGVCGTSSGDGLEQVVQKAKSTGAETYYRAARLYNSGSIAPGGNLGDGIATHCYCSDIANRLTGWFDGPSTCTLDG